MALLPLLIIICAMVFKLFIKSMYAGKPIITIGEKQRLLKFPNAIHISNSILLVAIFYMQTSLNIVNLHPYVLIGVTIVLIFFSYQNHLKYQVLLNGENVLLNRFLRKPIQFTLDDIYMVNIGLSSYIILLKNQKNEHLNKSLIGIERFIDELEINMGSKKEQTK